MARFATLYSGSSGNSSVIEENGRFLLMDMGGSCKATLGALMQLSLAPQNLDGILITHEHSDHIKGLAVFLKRVKVPLLATGATLDELWYTGAVPEDVELIAVEHGQQRQFAGFGLKCFATSHDAAGSCGWRVDTAGGRALALATDLGVMSGEVYACLEGAQVVALEANYDPQLLRNGPYPPSLKRRISSPLGHLANPEAAAVVVQLLQNGCRHVTLVHLSEENNRPHLALQAVEEALLRHGLKMPQECVVKVAPRYEPGEWVQF